MLKSYLKKIAEIAHRGDAREESYYSTLEALLKDYAESVGRKKFHVTTLPKKTEAGNPDFRIWDGTQHIVGYMEAKAPTVEHLDPIETSEQLKRYLHTFPNVILTNFFEFRLYRNGSLIDKVLIGRSSIVHRLGSIPPVEKESDFFKLLDTFFSFSLPKVYDAKALAVELAKRTRFLKDEVIAQELEAVGQTFLSDPDRSDLDPSDLPDHQEKQTGMSVLPRTSEKQTGMSVLPGTSVLHGFYEAFRKYLIGGLSKAEFADLYAQTITYGLFAARTRSENGFNRKLAYDSIPHTIGILRDVFKFVSLGDLPRQMEWVIDDISEVLAVTDVKQLLHQYFHEGRGKDPIVHFYETFLAEYDPQTREKRGVYYTPEPVVSYIVRSLHQLLKERFDKTDGFASTSVTVLDPAAGTLTFLAQAAQLAVKEFVSKYGEGGREKVIEEHILENFYAFELMMAPYAVGHLKMSFLLEELGYRLREDDRFKLYLTNTLEMEELAQIGIPGLASLSEESHLAGQVKREQPILVILGNPPYSGISANRGDWITGLIEDYKYVDGKHFGERKHWLQDDYVKFIRFAQWKIDEAGEGVLGFITNHSYLDNPTFRGMRQSLMNSFDEIYVLDLHGNSLKKERCPDGSKDENVFDIRQGVSIALFVKKKDAKKECAIYHSEIWGLREEKNDWLLENETKTTQWETLSPTSPYYFFVSREEKGREVYEKFWTVTDIFPVNCVGIVTARDKFVIDFDLPVLKRRIAMFRDLSMPDELIGQTFKLKDTSTFKLSKSREALSKDKNWEQYLTEILYRPFDKRNIYYTNIVVERPLLKVMRHMTQENLGLLFTRPQSPKYEFSVLISEKIIDQCVVGNKSAGAGISYISPLYLYPDTAKKDLFSQAKDPEKRQPNISPKLFAALSAAYEKKPAAEEIFYYIYAVLYSNTYRTKYAEFLKSDFPRIPFTSDYQLFGKVAEYGKRLVDLHLLKSAELDPPVAKFQGEGEERVEKLRYEEEAKRVYVNQSRYFEGVPKEVWQYQIGGYQVCNKWLKDRKGRRLSLEDIKHYCKIVTSLEKTIEIQKAIDGVYSEMEEETVEFGE